MKLSVKVISILDDSSAIAYGTSKEKINACVGRKIEVEIPNVPYFKGDRHIVDAHLPTEDSLRHGRQIGKMKVEVI